MRNTKQKGSLKWIVLIILGLVVASYFFDFDIQEAVEDPQTQSNFHYITDNAKRLYNTYLHDTVQYLWNDVFIDLLWNSFIENLEHVKSGDPTIFENLAPSVDLNTTADITNPPIGS